jgi:hypothetical protein
VGLAVDYTFCLPFILIQVRQSSVLLYLYYLQFNMVLGSAQALTEMITSNISWRRKAAGAYS